MNTAPYSTFDEQTFLNSWGTPNGYAFTFHTGDPADLGLTLNQVANGYRLNLAGHKQHQHLAKPSQLDYPLYVVSNVAADIWIQLDYGLNEIIGSWPGQ